MRLIYARSGKWTGDGRQVPHVTTSAQGYNFAGGTETVSFEDETGGSWQLKARAALPARGALPRCDGPCVRGARRVLCAHCRWCA